MKVKVEKVIHPSAWISGIGIGELRVANIPLKRAHSVRNLVSRFNRFCGKKEAGPSMFPTTALHTVWPSLPSVQSSETLNVTF